MNKQLWQRLLWVGVAAPYVYYLSRGEKNEYFNVGLKLLAGSIVVANIKPLLTEAAPFLKVLSDAALTHAKTIDAEARADAIDAEFVSRS